MLTPSQSYHTRMIKLHSHGDDYEIAQRVTRYMQTARTRGVASNPGCNINQWNIYIYGSSLPSGAGVPPYAHSTEASCVGPLRVTKVGTMSNAALL